MADPILKEKTVTKTKPPKMFKVVFLNDDYTTMDYVVDVLQRIYHKSQEEATLITLQVHQSGVGIAGTYTLEVGESLVAITINDARKHGHPLMAVLEPE